MQANTASAPAGATAISTGSLVRAPQSGTTNWISDRPSASASAKCPASTITRVLPCYCVRLLGFGRSTGLALPVALFLERIGHLAGHIILVVLGENGIGTKCRRALENAFGDDPLP